MATHNEPLGPPVYNPVYPLMCIARINGDPAVNHQVWIDTGASLSVIGEHYLAQHMTAVEHHRIIPVTIGGLTFDATEGPVTTSSYVTVTIALAADDLSGLPSFSCSFFVVDRSFRLPIIGLDTLTVLGVTIHLEVNPPVLKSALWPRPCLATRSLPTHRAYPVIYKFRENEGQ